MDFSGYIWLLLVTGGFRWLKVFLVVVAGFCLAIGRVR